MEKQNFQTIRKNKMLEGMKNIQNINDIVKKSRKTSPRILSKDQEEIQISPLKHSRYFGAFNLTDRKNNEVRSKQKPKHQDYRKTIEELKQKNYNLKNEMLRKENEIEQLQYYNQIMQKEIQKLQNVLQKIGIAVKPFQNNLTLMESQINLIKQTVLKVTKEKNESPKKTQNQITLRNTFNYELDTMQKTHKYEQEKYESKFFRLNLSLSQNIKHNKQLQQKIIQCERTIQILSAIINEGEYASRNRQLFHMANEQLLSYQYLYQKQKIIIVNQKNSIQKLRNKIMMLTSLIGYGVVSPIKNNDLYDIQIFKQNLCKRDSTHKKISNDVYGLSQLATDTKFQAFILMTKKKSQDNLNTIYLPNFLVFYDKELFNSDRQSEDNTTTIIKPQFFLTLRAILDSMYRQFMMNGNQTMRFCEFVYSFIHKFSVRKDIKNIMLNTKNINEDKQLVKTSFLLRLFDPKITNLPEIKTFREFLMNNNSQDEVLYYLIVRNLLMKGPQLKNYISCSDSYNFLQYEYVHHCLTSILNVYDKNTKEIIISNINSKKVTKNKINLIKAGYVLRLLLQVYRKDKKQKIQKLSILFDNVNQISKSQIMKFVYFWDILSKNYQYLSVIQICQYYRQTISVYQTDENISFFEAFFAVSSQSLFLSYVLKQELIFKKEIFKQLNQTPSSNYLMELIPDSIHEVGSQLLYEEYLELIKGKNLCWFERQKISKLLIKIADSKILKRCTNEEIDQYQKILDKFNNSIIDWVNVNIRKQRQYEQKLHKASVKIGRKVKVKIYEFYQQFINDIKKQLDSKQNN